MWAEEGSNLSPPAFARPSALHSYHLDKPDHIVDGDKSIFLMEMKGSALYSLLGGMTSEDTKQHNNWHPLLRPHCLEMSL